MNKPGQVGRPGAEDWRFLAASAGRAAHAVAPKIDFNSTVFRTALSHARLNIINLSEVHTMAAAFSNHGIELTLCDLPLANIGADDLHCALQLVLGIDELIAPARFGRIMGHPLKEVGEAALNFGVKDLAQNLGIDLVEARIDGAIRQTLPIDSLLQR